MATTVYELTGSMRNIETDAKALLFPRLQTCVAVIANTSKVLVGMHLTIANKQDLGATINKFREKIPETCAVYVVGAFAHWEGRTFSEFTAVSQMLYRYDTSPHGHVDVLATRGQGYEVDFTFKPQDAAENNYAPISPSSIKPVAA